MLKRKRGCNMSILVLGGAGYIGSHTVRALLDAGRSVVVADNLSTGFRQAVPDAVRFYQADIRSDTALNAIFQQEDIDGVIHFAARSQVGESMQNPLKYYDNNVIGTKTLLDAMIKHGVDKIVFSSTAAVYGQPERSPISESDSMNPTNCYGETKLAIEKMMKWVSYTHGLRYVALRYFNACGAHPSGQIGEAHQPESHLIPLILQVPLRQREKIMVFGADYPTPDGSCIRDYIHVCDLAQAHILALDYLLQGGESDIFNLGTGKGFSVKEVIAQAREVTGYPIPVENAPRREGDPARLVASSDKMKQKLNWKLQYDDLSAILATAWKWHQSHPHGYSK